MRNFRKAYQGSLNKFQVGELGRIIARKRIMLKWIAINMNEDVD